MAVLHICRMNEEFTTLLGQSTSLLEIAAMLTGILGVWLTVKHSVWCFPIGIVNVLLYAWLFFSPSVRLYADTLLQCIYVVLLVYGWMQWNKKDNTEEEFSPEKLTIKEWKNCILLFVAGSVTLGYFFMKFTDAALPWLDSALTSASLIGQWMVAKKKIENWGLWMLANAIYIPLFYIKHLPLTSLLYCIFFWMAISGYMEWKKLMRTVS